MAEGWGQGWDGEEICSLLLACGISSLCSEFCNERRERHLPVCDCWVFSFPDSLESVPAQLAPSTLHPG